MPTIGETVPGASAPLSWKSVRGKGDTGPTPSEKLPRLKSLQIVLIVIALIVGGSALLALIFRLL